MKIEIIHANNVSLLLKKMKIIVILLIVKSSMILDVFLVNVDSISILTELVEQ